MNPNIKTIYINMLHATYPRPDYRYPTNPHYTQPNQPYITTECRPQYRTSQPEYWPGLHQDISIYGPMDLLSTVITNVATHPHKPQLVSYLTPYGIY